MHPFQLLSVHVQTRVEEKASSSPREEMLLTCFVVCLLVCVGLFFAGCSSQSSEKEGDEATADAPKTILVAYFSATGNTQSVAEKIASHLDADVFELKPVEPYSQDDLNYNNGNSRVAREHEDPSLQDIALEQTTPENFDQYETVFIGYPIWWGQAAWPVDVFVTDNDFAGKTVVPFCTSASSPIGSSAQNLRALNETGTWLEGKQFSSSATQSDVDEWITSQVEPALS